MKTKRYPSQIKAAEMYKQPLKTRENRRSGFKERREIAISTPEMRVAFKNFMASRGLSTSLISDFTF